MNAKDEHHRIYVSIGGVSYHLTADENEEYMREIASKADKALKSISDSNPSLSNLQAGVLLIINLLDKISKLEKNIEKMESGKDALQKKNEDMEKELFIQRDANFELKKELISLNELNKKLSHQLASLQPEEEVLELEEEPDIPLDEPEEPEADPYQTSLDEFFPRS